VTYTITEALEAIESALPAYIDFVATREYLAVIHAALEPVNGEPVAWMRPNGNLARADAIKAGIPFDDFKDYTIPLYTNPQRELSDEEIDAIMTPLTQNQPYSWRKFARAVLEKARNG